MRLLDNPNGQWLAGPRWRRRNSGGTPTIVALMTGTAGNVVIAEDFASLGMVLSDASTITAFAWGISQADVDGAASLGIASTPADLSSLVGSTLWGKATAGGIGYYASHLISASPPAYATQPTTAGTLAVGNILTLEPGEATGLGTLTYAVTSLVLDGVDKTADVDQDTFEWATTDLIVYGAGGAFSYVVTATNEGGSVDSDTITGTLIDVPDAYAPGDWSVSPGADGQIDVTIATHPDNGNAAVSDIEYKIGAGAWTPSGGTGSFTITGESPGLKAIQIQDVNAAGTGLPSEIKQVTVTGASPVNPVISSAVYTSGSGGNPATIALSVQYSGDDTLRVCAVTGISPMTVTAAQLKNGSGGTNTLEFFNYTYTPPSNLATIGGLTAASEGANRIRLYVEEENNGGASAITAITVSALDFTAPAFASGVPADNATGVSITASPALTFGSPVFAPPSGGQFYLYNTTGPTLVETFSMTTGVGTNGGSVTVSGSTVTLSPGNQMDATTGHSIRWNTGAVVDASGNPVAANTSDTLYNFTTSGGFTETGVVSSSATYLQGATTLADRPGFLYFGSFIQPTSARSTLLSFDGSNGYVRADNVDGDGLLDPRARIKCKQPTGPGFVLALQADPIAVNQRVHFMAAARTVDIGGGTYRATMTIATWKAAAGLWTVKTVTDDSKDNGPNLYLSGAPLRLGSETGAAISRPFVGRQFRQALWSFASAASVPDITSSTVRDYFASGGTLASPAIARAQFGTPIVDFNGSKDDWNNGVHNGSMAFTLASGAYT